MSGYACPICRKDFPSNRECRDHVRREHSEAPFAEPVEIPAFARLPDPVNHPTHYTSHPSGIECITITRHMGFNLGNAIKYIWRADLKNGTEDLRKAVWYIEDEIKRRETQKPVDLQPVSDFEHVQGDVSKT